MANEIYVGIAKQQNIVIKNLSNELKSEPRGIFVVGGAGRVGKNTVVTNVIEEIHGPIVKHGFEVVRPDVNVYDDGPELYLSHWKEAYDNGSRLFSLGEIPIQFSSTLSEIKNFYYQSTEGVKIVFNSISRTYPAWKNDEIKSEMQSVLKRYFPRDLHLFTLNTDPELIIKELWRIKEGRIGYDMLTRQFGFNLYTEQFQKASESSRFDEYHQLLDGIMNQKKSSNPERGM